MGTIGAGFSMSLDGFIADVNDDVTRLFAWMSEGNTEIAVSSGDTDYDLRFSEKGAESYQDTMNMIGAIVSGRRMFDVANAWGGKHPFDVPVFVVTHSVPKEWDRDEVPFRFITDGVESAIEQARAIAGDKNVGVGGANIAQQYLRLGLLDEISITLVPVLLGSGIRLFDYLGIEPVELQRIRYETDNNVTHLTFRILK